MKAIEAIRRVGGKNYKRDGTVVVEMNGMGRKTKTKNRPEAKIQKAILNYLDGRDDVHK